MLLLNLFLFNQFMYGRFMRIVEIYVIFKGLDLPNFVDSVTVSDQSVNRLI